MEFQIGGRLNNKRDRFDEKNSIPVLPDGWLLAT